jgi:hypothetical protein
MSELVTAQEDSKHSIAPGDRVSVGGWTGVGAGRKGGSTVLVQTPENVVIAVGERYAVLCG